MILDRIIAAVSAAAARRQAEKPLSEIESLIAGKPAARDFRAAVSRPGGINVIAEMKRASPSAGTIRADLDPALMARRYEEAGAAALSVLTENSFFRGTLDDLREASGACSVPVLQKDFILSPYQVAEARAAGADAVLLIVAVLGPGMTGRLLSLAGDFGLSALVEVHDEKELETALESGASTIGINNRNLKTLETDAAVTYRLLPLIPGGRAIVSESGLKTRQQIVSLSEAGVDAFLVGERLLNDPDPSAALRELLAR